MSLESLVAQADWVRGLARSLVSDLNTAEDLTQDTLVAALEHPPAPGPLRPWLAGVVRNLARLRQRGEGRREYRERRGARGEALPATDVLVEQVETQRRLARAVLLLDEPYRTTLLWRYWQRLSSAEIARRQGLPGATVRSRLKRGLDELRARLDAESGGDRSAWTLALAPIAAVLPGEARRGVLPLFMEVLLMKTGKNLALAGVIVLCLALGVTVIGELELGRDDSAPPPPELSARMELSAASRRESLASPTPPPEPAPQETPSATPPPVAPAPVAASVPQVVQVEQAAPVVLLYDPRSGLTLRKHLTNRLQAEVRYEVHSPDAQLEQPPIEGGKVESTQVLTVVDQYVTSFGGVPSEVHRKFERAQHSTGSSFVLAGMQQEGEEVERTSPLQGAALRLFHVDRGRYDVSPFPAGLAPASAFDGLPDVERSELARGLEFDLDFASLLPEGGVELGRRWKIKPRQLVALLNPGGDLGFGCEEDRCLLHGLVPLPGAVSLPELCERLRGTADLRFAEVVEEGALRIGVVEIELSLRLNEDVSRALKRRHKESVCAFDWNSYRVEWEYEGAGKLLWDLDERHPLSLDIEGDLRAKMRPNLRMDAGGRKVKLVVEQTLEGELQLEARIQSVR